MEYLGLIIGYLIIVLTPAFGLWFKFLPRMEKPGWTAFVPFYNYYVALRACNQPWYWVLFLLLPGIQFYMWAAINVTVVRKFGLYSVKDTILAIIFPFPVFYKIAMAKEGEKLEVAPPTNWDIEKQVNLRTPSDHVALFFIFPILGNIAAYVISFAGFKRKSGKKSVVKEWGDAILFALIAASAIRTYVFEPYTIPTGSMEKTLMVGDYLFVEKITFGPRIPMTPFSFPVVHNNFPWINVRSYVEIQKIPFSRLPGFRDLERYDVTVFNFPAGDTAIADYRMPYGLVGHTYEQVLANEAFYIAKWNRKEFESKKDYYVDLARKRIRDEHRVESNIEGSIEDRDAPYGYRLIRGIDFGGFGSGLLPRPVDKRENYIKRCVGIPGDLIEVKEQILFVNNQEATVFPHQQRSYQPKPKGIYHIEADSTPFKPEFYQVSYFPIFPNDPQYDWSEDNFGPLKIPSRGDVVELTHKTLPIYRRIITAYEGHSLQETAEGIFIDGKKVTSYTVEMNYYWLMGDNRNNSADSRFWGFVPEDHIVGRAAFIWMSRGEEGVRWERIFTGIK